jgi:hypothetical protein
VQVLRNELGFARLSSASVIAGGYAKDPFHPDTCREPDFAFA